MTENQRVERVSSLNSHENRDYLENQEIQQQQQQPKYTLQLRAVLSSQSLLACTSPSISRMQNEHTSLQHLFDITNEKFTLNDYVLIEENDLNDSSYGTAYNQVKNQFFYWKVSKLRLDFLKLNMALSSSLSDAG